MSFDPAIYRHYLDGLDMSDAAKLACMRAFWAFLESELDRLSGGAPEQILLGIRANTITSDLHDQLNSTHSLVPDFNYAARAQAARKSRP